MILLRFSVLYATQCIQISSLDGSLVSSSNEKTEFLGKNYDRLSEAKAVAANSDVVVLCIGLDETLEGEEGDTGNAYSSGDKKDLKFPPSQIKLLETLIETKVPLIVVSMAGSAMDLSLADKNANAVIQAWYPCARGGKEVAELLFGDYSPSGKLPVTFYRDEDLKDMPDFEDYSMKGRTYRYIEKEPLYPFGYGLSYADVKIADASFKEAKNFDVASQEGITVNVKASNASAVDTEEVLQVYVHVNGTRDEVLNTKLAAFKRVKLAAGAEITFEITVPAFAFTTVDDEGIRSVTGNGADIYVGFNGPDKRSEALTGNAALVLKL